jgi:hypothetical protein
MTDVSDFSTVWNPSSYPLGLDALAFHARTLKDIENPQRPGTLLVVPNQVVFSYLGLVAVLAPRLTSLFRVGSRVVVNKGSENIGSLAGCNAATIVRIDYHNHEVVLLFDDDELQAPVTTRLSQCRPLNLAANAAFLHFSGEQKSRPATVSTSFNHSPLWMSIDHTPVVDTLCSTLLTVFRSITSPCPPHLMKSSQSHNDLVDFDFTFISRLASSLTFGALSELLHLERAAMLFLSETSYLERFYAWALSPVPQLSITNLRGRVTAGLLAWCDSHNKPRPYAPAVMDVRASSETGNSSPDDSRESHCMEWDIARAPHCVFGPTALSFSSAGGNSRRAKACSDMPVLVVGNAVVNAGHSNRLFYFEVTISVQSLMGFEVGLVPDRDAFMHRTYCGWVGGSVVYNPVRQIISTCRKDRPCSLSFPLSSGQLVDCKDSVGRWEPAVVIDVDCNGRHLIHYCDWDERYDEWIMADQAPDRLAFFRAHTNGRVDHLDKVEIACAIPTSTIDITGASCTVGVAIDPVLGQLRFTCNGRAGAWLKLSCDGYGSHLTDTESTSLFRDGSGTLPAMYPAVLVHGINSRCTANFGRDPFVCTEWRDGYVGTQIETGPDTCTPTLPIVMASASVTAVADGPESAVVDYESPRIKVALQLQQANLWPGPVTVMQIAVCIFCYYIIHTLGAGLFRQPVISVCVCVYVCVCVCVYACMCMCAYEEIIQAILRMHRDDRAAAIVWSWTRPSAFQYLQSLTDTSWIDVTDSDFEGEAFDAIYSNQPSFCTVNSRSHVIDDNSSFGLASSITAQNPAVVHWASNEPDEDERAQYAPASASGTNGARTLRALVAFPNILVTIIVCSCFIIFVILSNLEFVHELSSCAGEQPCGATCECQQS